MQVRKMESTEPLRPFKEQYIRQATAPLDGMWLCGFVPMATHFGLYDDSELAGFFCVNDEGFLLQFFVAEGFRQRSSELFGRILQDGAAPVGPIRGAFVSTAEPLYLSLCLDLFSKFEVNALMYQHTGAPQPESDLELTVLQLDHLSEAIDFAIDSIGAPEDWLRGYYTNLIERRELFGLWQDDRLVAAGESRGYDEYQVGYADVGIIVAKSERGRGLATRVLRQLVRDNEARGLESICSTESTNLAAQKAIGRAGFFAGHRILRFSE